MKVLHIINSLGTGGAEKLLVESLHLYEQFNVEVELFLLDGSETPFFKELKKTFTGRIIKSQAKSIYSPSLIREIYKTIIDGDYSIVHVHLFPTLYWVAFAKWIYRLPTKLIFTEHSTENKRINNQLYRLFDKWIYRQYSHITAITPEVKKKLIEKLKISPNKITVIYNGIDISRFEKCIQNDIERNDGEISLVQVSRFSEHKDQKTVIRALSLLPDKYKLILVGDGLRREEAQQLAISLKLNDRVTFMGVRMDIPEILSSSDIIIQSSNWEGFGIAALEGMACAKPVIASDVPGLANIVDGYGILFSKGNEADLASKIKSLDNNTRIELGRKCFERAKEFGIDKMVEKMVKIYNNLV